MKSRIKASVHAHPRKTTFSGSAEAPPVRSDTRPGVCQESQPQSKQVASKPPRGQSTFHLQVPCPRDDCLQMPLRRCDSARDSGPGMSEKMTRAEALGRGEIAMSLGDCLQTNRHGDRALSNGDRALFIYRCHVPGMIACKCLCVAATLREILARECQRR